MNIAIIPARGGSKRVPGKNIKEFCGRPMLAWPVEAAKKSGLFEKIIVSTDDEDIARVARHWGAEVPFMRPSELADDHTPVLEVIRHTLQQLEKSGSRADYVCCILATAVFLQPRYLEQGLEMIRQKKCSFAFSVASYEFPIQKSLRIKNDGSVEPMFPEYFSHRSQDLEEAYHDAGQFYWGTPESFQLETGDILNCSRPVILPRHLVQDIDTPEDWERAEMMFRILETEVRSPWSDVRGPGSVVRGP